MKRFEIAGNSVQICVNCEIQYTFAREELRSLMQSMHSSLSRPALPARQSLHLHWGG